ncbi:hypothetical protein JHK86_043370 [Glycine max]|nr:hypothetical protein JHK86_043370 [Glycine max]
MVLVPRPWLSAHANTEAWLRNGEECRILLTASSPDGCTSGQKTCRNHKLDDALRALWSAAFPEEELHGLISEQWKDMGWQGLMGTENMRGSMGLILLVVLIQNPSAAEDARLASLISLDRILKQIKDLSRFSTVNTIEKSKKRIVLDSLDKLTESLLEIDHPCVQSQVRDNLFLGESDCKGSGVRALNHGVIIGEARAHQNYCCQGNQSKWRCLPLCQYQIVYMVFVIWSQTKEIKRLIDNMVQLGKELENKEEDKDSIVIFLLDMLEIVSKDIMDEDIEGRVDLCALMSHH